MSAEQILYEPDGQHLVVATGSGTFYTDEALSAAVSVGDALATTDTVLWAPSGTAIRIVLAQIDGDLIHDETFTLSSGEKQPPRLRPGPGDNVKVDASYPRWDDLRVSLSTARATGSGNPTFSPYRDGVYAWAFSKAADETVYFEVQLPHSWLAGSEIRPHVHWSPGVSADTGSVRWELEWTWANAVAEPGNVFPETDSDTVDQAAAGAYAHQIAQFAGISGTGKRLSSVLMCRLSRLGTATEDTFDAVAFGLSVDFHIQNVGHGSREEYPD